MKKQKKILYSITVLGSPFPFFAEHDVESVHDSYSSTVIHTENYPELSGGPDRRLSHSCP
jgi:hypothetical protein